MLWIIKWDPFCGPPCISFKLMPPPYRIIPQQFDLRMSSTNTNFNKNWHSCNQLEESSSNHIFFISFRPPYICSYIIFLLISGIKFWLPGPKFNVLVWLYFSWCKKQAICLDFELCWLQFSWYILILFSHASFPKKIQWISVNFWLTSNSKGKLLKLTQIEHRWLP